MGASNESAPDLVPLFIPPLATLLAKAEITKGARLTEQEVVAIRDGAVCMMTRREEADAMAASRGFLDVVPSNCWADWHRLRVQMTGRGCLPKLVLCILGGTDLESRCRPHLERLGVEYECHGADTRMETAFKASACGAEPSLGQQDFERIRQHATVLYVVGRNTTAADAPRAGAEMLALGRTLLEAGGTAMKCESSGIAHSRERWIHLSDQGESWQSLWRAFVQHPIQSRADFYTCGMHLLGQADLIAAEPVLRAAAGSAAPSAAQAARLFEAFRSLAMCVSDLMAPGGPTTSDEMGRAANPMH